MILIFKDGNEAIMTEQWSISWEGNGVCFVHYKRSDMMAFSTKHKDAVAQLDYNFETVIRYIHKHKDFVVCDLRMLDVLDPDDLPLNRGYK